MLLRLRSRPVFCRPGSGKRNDCFAAWRFRIAFIILISSHALFTHLLCRLAFRARAQHARPVRFQFPMVPRHARAAARAHFPLLSVSPWPAIAATVPQAPMQRRLGNRRALHARPAGLVRLNVAPMIALSVQPVCTRRPARRHARNASLEHTLSPTRLCARNARRARIRAPVRLLAWPGMRPVTLRRHVRRARTRPRFPPPRASLAPAAHTVLRQP